jgi:hypothetical protein
MCVNMCAYERVCVCMCVHVLYVRVCECVCMCVHVLYVRVCECVCV